MKVYFRQHTQSNRCLYASSSMVGTQPKFLVEKRKGSMFITISTYWAKPGEEDAIVALYEDWQRNQLPEAKGYLSGELMRDIETPRKFIAIMRFESRESAQALANDPEQNAWFGRLVSLMENVPVLTEYNSDWHG